jgi:murein DD-endopeptidase MepM/ murein hydrolase activator NlpD
MNLAAASISMDSKNIYLGTPSRGLWISEDNGQNWVQKTADVKIRIVRSYGNETYYSNENNTFLTKDQGKTWEQINSLNGKIVYHILLTEKSKWASTNEGLYRKLNEESEWKKVNETWNYGLGAITAYQGIIFAGVREPTINSAKVYFTKDDGNSWNDSGLVINNYSEVKSIDWVFSSPAIIFANISGNGIYKYALDEPSDKFLGQLWVSPKKYDHYEKIYSFFDHKYPFLGSGLSEPWEERYTTLNFFGFRVKEPFLYYSSHNGIDFSLPYGTEIISPANGYVTFTPCTPCGNALSIDHRNGYQTKYMHLQKSDLITTSNTPVFVLKGEKLGRVGMTGNTTGPHLHFEITKDTNNDGSFIDETPLGKIDPYGWTPADITKDPWREYISSRGIRGPESIILWENTAGQSTFISQPTEVILDNRRISIDQLISSEPATLTSSIPGTLPKLGNYEYISDTSLHLRLTDQLGYKITNLKSPIKIGVIVPLTVFNEFIEDSIKFYFYNENNDLWESLPTILDKINNKVTCEIPNLSLTGVFGIRTDETVPTSELNIINNENANDVNGWYTVAPIVKLSVNPQQASIYLSKQGESEWHEYLEPEVISEQGVHKIEFRSTYNNNVEATNEQIVMINIEQRTTTKVSVKGTNFSIN